MLSDGALNAWPCHRVCGRTDHRPLKDSRTKVSSASTILLQRSRLVACRGAEKPMPLAEGRRRMNAAERRGLRQPLALDHRSGVIEPALLLAQMRQRRLGQGVEGASATLAANRKRPCERPQPTTSRPAQCGQPWLSTRSWLANPSLSSRRLRFVALPRFAPSETFEPERASPPSALLSASETSRRCAQARNRR